MIEEVSCPGCGGPALIELGEVCCSLCGNQAVSEIDSLSDDSPEQALVSQAMATIEMPASLRIEVDRLLFEKGLAEIEKDILVERSFRYFLGFVEAFEGLPKVNVHLCEPQTIDFSVPERLLSSLGGTCTKLQLSPEKAASLAFYLYLTR